MTCICPRATRGLVPGIPISIATRGFINLDDDTGLTSSWREQWRKDYERQKGEPLPDNVELIEINQGEVLEVENAPVYTVKPAPIKANSQPVSEIQGIDYELAVELRKAAIREHAEAERQKLEELRRFKDELALVLILSEV